MKLSKLAYLCVKNVLYYNDPTFTYEGFLLGDFDNNPDYDTNINNVFSPINEAIARLNDLERMPYKMVEGRFLTGTKTINLKNLSNSDQEPYLTINFKEIVKVGQFVDGKPVAMAFKVSGNFLYVVDIVYRDLPIYIEYKEDIPMFSREDIPSKDPSTDELYDEDDELYREVELRDYEINDAMCNYIMEYAQGKLEEQIDPNIANMHITRAEAYFSNIEPVKPVFTQRIIKNIYRIGE